MHQTAHHDGQAESPTAGEMVEEVVNIVIGLGIALLPALVFAVPGLVLLLPLLLLALPFAIAAALLAAAYLLVRSIPGRTR
jgi:hypothetical protein